MRIDWKDAPEHGDAADFTGDVDALLDDAEAVKPARKVHGRNDRSARASEVQTTRIHSVWAARGKPDHVYLARGKVFSIEGDPVMVNPPW